MNGKAKRHAAMASLSALGILSAGWAGAKISERKLPPKTGVQAVGVHAHRSDHQQGQRAMARRRRRQHSHRPRVGVTNLRGKKVWRLPVPRQ